MRPVRMVLILDSHCWSSSDGFFGAAVMTTHDVDFLFVIVLLAAIQKTGRKPTKNQPNWMPYKKLGEALLVDAKQPVFTRKKPFFLEKLEPLVQNQSYSPKSNNEIVPQK